MNSEGRVRKEVPPRLSLRSSPRDYRSPRKGGMHDTKSKPRQLSHRADSILRMSSAHLREKHRCTPRSRRPEDPLTGCAKDRIPIPVCNTTFGMESSPDVREA